MRNPLMYSGLLFSGANLAWTGDSALLEVEDGILTSDEISKLNLSGTKLVVLSACETGLGKISDTEGVLGLQRAFKLAGVQTLVMSLWEVSDQVTKSFMSKFYKEITAGKSIQQSFRNAQFEIKKQYPNPYYWAAFVILD